MDTPLLSVIIPTHERRHLLDEVISRLSDQTFAADRFEVIVVLDGSTDGSLEMLERKLTSFDLRVVSQHQAGPAVARNRGASLARGDVLLFLDDDILAKTELLERHWELHARDEWAVVIGKILPAAGRTAEGQGGWSAWEAQVLERHFEAMRTGKRPPAGRRLYSGNFSVRKSLFQEVGGFDESLTRGEDVEVGLRMQDAGARFYFEPEAAGIHCGFRSFESWAMSSLLYGRCDVRLTQEKGRDTLGLVLSWYDHQSLLLRLGLAVGLQTPWIRTKAVGLLRRAGGVLMRARLRSAAFKCYGAIYKLQYWQGVRDQLGGRQIFSAYLEEWREGRLATPVEGQAA